MAHAYDVRVLSTEVLEEIPGAWSSARLTGLLAEMEYGDTAGMSDAELREMCLLSLNDHSPDEAAAIVLRFQLGDRLRDGQIKNWSYEMMDETLWEHSADMELHEELFNVASLLFAAMPGEFPTPDAVRVRLEVTAKSKDARDVLNAPPLESWVVRLLADGMDGDAVLHRLFDKQLLAKQPFDEAKYIAWIVSSNRIGPDAIELDVIGSGYWMDALLETEAYSSNAKSDCVLAE